MIKAAENEAAKTVAKATDKAQIIISNARVASSETVTKAQSSTQKKARKLIDKARSRATKEAGKVEKKGDVFVSDIHEAGEKNRKTAIDVVISAIINE